MPNHEVIRGATLPCGIVECTSEKKYPAIPSVNDSAVNKIYQLIFYLYMNIHDGISREIPGAKHDNISVTFFYK